MSDVNVLPHRKRLAGHDLLVREVTLDDMEQLRSLTASVGFSTARSEQEAIITHCPGYTIGAFLEDGTLACASMTTTTDVTLAYVADFMGRPELQGRGIGSHVFKVTLERCRGRNVIIDAKSAAVSLYVRNGFSYDDVKTHKYEGVPAVPADYSPSDDLELSAITEKNVDEAVEYEMGVYHAPRALSRAYWLCPEATGHLAVRSGKVCGCLALWPLPNHPGSYRVSQFCADTCRVAEDLVVKAIQSLPAGAPLKFYVINKNEAAIERLLPRFGMQDKQLPPSESLLVKLYTEKKISGIEYSKVYSAYFGLM